MMSHHKKIFDGQLIDFTILYLFLLVLLKKISKVILLRSSIHTCSYRYDEHLNDTKEYLMETSE
jgi:hypothetical protein